MAQVTMEGREYVELINGNKMLEAQVQELVDVLILGKLKVDEEAYFKVKYEVVSELPEKQAMQKYKAMRVRHVVELLEEDPEAVRMLYESNYMHFNVCTGFFGSYQWDDTVMIKDMSDKLREMWEQLEQAEQEEEEDEQDEI